MPSKTKKTISVVTPCYNEEGNVGPLSERVRAVFDALPGYDYEHIFADNASTDGTLGALKEMAAGDKRIKVIANTANFGPVKSVFNAVLAATGDAVVVLSADLQDPPELISEFVEKWEEGFQVVFGVREKRHESGLMVLARKLYYRLLRSVSEDRLIDDAGDFVLFDKAVLDVLKRIKDTNPYIRGLLTSLGFSYTGVKYSMQQRSYGKSSTNLFRLFIYALNGFVNHTMLPLRLATVFGLIMSFVCFVIATASLLIKIFFWESSGPPGIPTLIVGLFFLSGIQLFLIGFIGEYIGAIHRQSKGLPLVVEKERINFSKGKPKGKKADEKED